MTKYLSNGIQTNARYVGNFLNLDRGAVLRGYSSLLITLERPC